VVFISFFFFLIGLRFEHRASGLQSRSSTAWATPAVHFALVILEMGVLWNIFLSWPRNTILLISASQVDKNYRCEQTVLPEKSCFKIKWLNFVASSSPNSSMLSPALSPLPFSCRSQATLTAVAWSTPCDSELGCTHRQSGSADSLLKPNNWVFIGAQLQC
jgi:hypothetical protein